MLVDESRTSARVHRAVARTTKTHRDRTLPIHPKLREVLGALPRHADGLVFHRPVGGQLKPDVLRNVLIRAVLTPLAKQFPPRSGQSLLVGRLHSFRHFFASVAASSGDVDADTLMTWLGHRDSQMVRHYFHIFENRATAQMNSIRFVMEPSVTSTDGSIS